MSLVLDVAPDQTEDTVYVRLPNNGGIVRLRVMTYERPDRRNPDRKHRSVRAVIDAPDDVEIVRAATLDRSGVDIDTWASGAVNLRRETNAGERVAVREERELRARVSLVATIAPPKE